MLFNFKKDEDGYWKWFAGNLASGGLAGVVLLMVGYPFNYARTRLANDIKAIQYSDWCVQENIAIRRLKWALQWGLYFGLYDSLKPMVSPGGLQDSFTASFVLGWGTTICATMATYPIDTVRRRLMMTSGEAVKYKNSLDAFAQIAKNEGATSLFKGAGVNILCSVAGAAVLAGYDQTQIPSNGPCLKLARLLPDVPPKLSIIVLGPVVLQQPGFSECYCPSCNLRTPRFDACSRQEP
ncbi:hypothetical protein Cgig2_014784 [Carnegiea gigantea]|uniref:ADP/ATP translocase n=1 Tax=Carnegiea gigantea TaxID=171969 RepID=A0A9Q1L263_9CARY|nr:hypothetical protein Cgig2_014784 [Carnegiea gigantea]